MAGRSWFTWSALLFVVVGCGALLVAGCGDSGSSTPPPSYSPFGGQTGALLPPIDPDACGPRLGPDEVLTVSTEDPGFVAVGAALDFSQLTDEAGDAGVQDAGAVDAAAADAGTAGANASAWELQGEDGETVALGSEDNGATNVLRPLNALAPGEYTLNYSCAGVTRTAAVQVVEPGAPKQAPHVLVTNVSLAYEPHEHVCSEIDERVTLELTLSARRKALADATQLSLRGDGIDLVIAPYASIDASERVLEVGVPICREEARPNCLPKGVHDLTLVSEFLNEPESTNTLRIFVDTTCLDQVDAGVSSSGPFPEDSGCAVTQKPRAREPRNTSWPSLAVWTALGATALLWRRRALALLARRGERR